MPRADANARRTVLVLVVLTGVHGVLALRGIAADGAFDLYSMLAGDWLLNPTRAFAAIVQQAPGWLAIGLGITNVHVIAVVHSLGVVGVPTLCWTLALWLLRSHRLFWPMAVTYGVVYLNSGLIAIGQYNLLYGYVVLSVAILLRSPRLGRSGAVGLVLLALLMTRTYESVFFLGPPLAALVVLTWWRGRAEAPRWEAVARWIAVALILLAAVLGLVGALAPNDPVNRAGAADVLSGFLVDPQLMISAAIGVLMLVARLLLRGRAAIVAGRALLAATAVLLVPALWAVPWMHYSARTPAGLLLFVLLVLALLPEFRRIPVVEDGATGQAALLRWLGPFALVVVLTVSFTVQTQAFRNWLATFEEALHQSTGEVELHTTPAVDQFWTYGWPWTNPFLSALLRSSDSTATILSPGKHPGEETTWDIPEQFNR